MFGLRGALLSVVLGLLTREAMAVTEYELENELANIHGLDVFELIAEDEYMYLDMSDLQSLIKKSKADPDMVQYLPRVLFLKDLLEEITDERKRRHDEKRFFGYDRRTFEDEEFEEQQEFEEHQDLRQYQKEDEERRQSEMLRQEESTKIPAAGRAPGVPAGCCPGPSTVNPGHNPNVAEGGSVPAGDRRLCQAESSQTGLVFLTVGIFFLIFFLLLTMIPREATTPEHSVFPDEIDLEAQWQLS